MQHVVAEIKQEMEIQSRLHHPNILPFFGAVFDSNNFPKFVLSEYMPQGSVATLLDKSPTGIPLPKVVQTARETIAGLFQSRLRERSDPATLAPYSECAVTWLAILFP